MNIEFNHLIDVYSDMHRGKNHSHPNYELFFFISGDCTYFAGNSCYRMSYGDVVITKPGELHMMDIESGCKSEHYLLYIDPQSFNALSEDAQNPLAFMGNRPIGTDNIVKLTPDQIEEVLRCFRALEEKSVDSDFNGSLDVFTNVMCILNILNQAFLNREVSVEQIALHPTCRLLLEYVNANFQTIHGLEDVAEAMKMSAPYLSRLFKQQTGISLMKYIRQKKLAMAKRLLCEGSSVTDACYAAGFDNYTHFITLFRKEVGVSPREFRNQVK